MVDKLNVLPVHCATRFTGGGGFFVDEPFFVVLLFSGFRAAKVTTFADRQTTLSRGISYCWALTEYLITSHSQYICSKYSFNTSDERLTSN